MSKQKAVASPVAVGNAVLIRAVTNYYTGRIAAVTKDEVVLVEAAWIADMGRFADALDNGKLSEVEPYPAGPVSINRGAIVDVCLWAHALPRDQK